MVNVQKSSMEINYKLLIFNKSHVCFILKCYIREIKTALQLRNLLIAGEKTL